ncbi:hypothetical protein V6Z11_A12G277000 [Gossypium hirsutum]
MLRTVQQSRPRQHSPYPSVSTPALAKKQTSNNRNTNKRKILYYYIIIFFSLFFGYKAEILILVMFYERKYTHKEYKKSRGDFFLPGILLVFYASFSFQFGSFIIFVLKKINKKTVTEEPYRASKPWISPPFLLKIEVEEGFRAEIPLGAKDPICRR